jgi:hypothetical protein
MRLHLLHIAKFVALVALAVIITHSLGSRAAGTLERARPLPREGVSGTHLRAGRHHFAKPWDEKVNREYAAGIRHEDGTWRAEGRRPIASAAHDAAEEVVAESEGGVISSFAKELKSTITLLRAYSEWIRTSPDPMS